MKITVTGSLGHISKPLTEELLQRSHTVTVVSSSSERVKDIEVLGAKAAVGSLEDADFLTATFNGADAVYCMIPPNNYFDQSLDLSAYYRRIAGNYAQAVQDSGVRRVVYLSSIGAHLEKGSGILIGHHEGEKIMSNLPDVSITFMRPTGFYYNLYGFVPVVKSAGVIAANWGAGEKLVWVSPKDIAAAAVEELETPLEGNKIRYVASDELSGGETAEILGAAIGKPDLKWILISDEEYQSGLQAAGMNSKIAASLVEMYASMQNGLLMEDYYRHKPELGKVKLTDFAKEFAAAFNQK